MRILDGNTCLAPVLVLILGFSAPTTANARAKFSINASDWLFTEADNSRIDNLAQHSAALWNVIGDEGSRQDFQEMHRMYKGVFGALDGVAGSVRIWKPGDAISIRDGSQKTNVEFLLQSELRIVSGGIGEVLFSETRELYCKEKCKQAVLQIKHYSRTQAGLGLELDYPGTYRFCRLAGKTLSYEKKSPPANCKDSVSWMRPNENLGATLTKHNVYTAGEATSLIDDRFAKLRYSLWNADGSIRKDHDVIAMDAGAGVVIASLVSLEATPWNGVKMEASETFVRSDNPFRGIGKALSYLCDPKWGTCVNDHIVGWESDSDGLVSLSIDGCGNGVCFKGSLRGKFVNPTTIFRPTADDDN